MTEGWIISERVDDVVRLHRDPPVMWDGQTVWLPIRDDGEVVLREYAHINCADCGERAYWAKGNLACDHCQTTRRLVG